MSRSLFLVLFVSACSSTAGSPDAPGAAAGSGGPIDEDAIEQREGAGQVSGLVVDPATGKPVALATVMIVRPDESDPIADSITDARGKYALNNIEPGTYRIVVVHGSLQNETRGVVVIANETTTLKHDLSSYRKADGSDGQTTSAIESQLGVISGRVLDGARGEPFPGVTIEVAADHLGQSIFTLANEQGRFEVRNLKPATYVVSAYYTLVDKGNVEIRRSGVVVERGVATELTLEIDTEAQ